MSRNRAAVFSEELDEKYQQFRDEHGVSNSDALRMLVRSGLEQNRSEEDAYPTREFALQWLLTAGSMSAVASVGALAISSRITAGLLGVVALVTNGAALAIRFGASQNSAEGS
jgi:hypothetical protein